MTTWEHNTTVAPGYATEVTASRVVELMQKAMRLLKPRKRLFTCLLMSEAHVRQLKTHTTEADKPPEKAFETLDQCLGLPVYVYRTQEERFTLRAYLIQAGHYVCEVE